MKGQKHHFALGHEASMKISDTGKFIATEEFTVQCYLRRQSEHVTDMNLNFTQSLILEH